jgi:hypothetical protein
MMIASSHSDRSASAARLQAYRRVRGVFPSFLMIAARAILNLPTMAWAIVRRHSQSHAAKSA